MEVNPDSNNLIISKESQSYLQMPFNVVTINNAPRGRVTLVVTDARNELRDIEDEKSVTNVDFDGNFISLSQAFVTDRSDRAMLAKAPVHNFLSENGYPPAYLIVISNDIGFLVEVSVEDGEISQQIVDEICFEDLDKAGFDFNDLHDQFDPNDKRFPKSMHEASKRLTYLLSENERLLSEDFAQQKRAIRKM